MRLLVLLSIPVALWWFCINASCQNLICRLLGDAKTTSCKMNQVSDLHPNYLSINETGTKLAS